MEIPVHNITAAEIAVAATQSLVTTGFVTTHNQRAVLLLSASFLDVLSDDTTPIQAGVRAGQLLTIVLIADASSKFVKIQDAGNCALNGMWWVGAGNGVGSWLQVVWTGSVWQEVGRGSGSTTASGVMAHTEGIGTTASGRAGHAEGRSTTASGDDSHAEGAAGTASLDVAHSEGYGSLASGLCSHASGYYGNASQVAQYAHGGDRFASTGDAQFSRFVCIRQETHSTNSWRTIGLDKSSTGPVIPADSSWTFEARVIGQTQDAAKVLSYLVSGCIKRVGNTTTLLASTVTVVYEDDASFGCQAVANDTAEALEIQVQDTDAASDVVRWVCIIELAQITYT